MICLVRDGMMLGLNGGSNGTAYVVVVHPSWRRPRSWWSWLRWFLVTDRRTLTSLYGAPLRVRPATEAEMLRAGVVHQLPSGETVH